MKNITRITRLMLVFLAFVVSSLTFLLSPAIAASSPEERSKQFFQIADSDKNGFIEESDYKQFDAIQSKIFFDSLNLNPYTSEFDEALDILDSDGDNKVSFEEVKKKLGA
ncbi:hypothetical protein H6G93_17290 [Nostoc sp. FACHB-973]|nr:hypothetical protein [Nostoc sp. FACHB-973]